jgi:hypothetical protein
VHGALSLIGHTAACLWLARRSRSGDRTGMDGTRVAPLSALTTVIYGWVFAATLIEDRPILPSGAVEVYGTFDGSEG